MRRSLCLSFALLTAALVTGRSPAADEPTVTKKYLGAETGTVVKVESGSITLKENKTVQTGVSQRRTRGGVVAVPRFGNKTVEVTYPVALDVEVKTAAGKSAKLEDVKPGGMVRVHGYKVTEKAAGEKAVSRVEVRRIDIPDSAAGTETTSPTTEK